jgi:hypothetical protein
MSTTIVQPDDQNKSKNDRSPAYPFISLKTAIERAKELYREEKRNPAPVPVVVKHWGYKEKSSGGIQTIAALKYYGLLIDTGSGDSRKVQLSDAGLKIAMDERTISPERDNLIKQAALRPKIYAKLWETWGSAMPSEENVNYYLRVELKFADNVVPNFIRGYKDTISFAKLTESDKVMAEDGSSANTGEGSYVPQVGDYVQWESQGVLQFKEPAKVLSISTDRAYAFVEGTSTGIPVKEMIRAAAPSKAPQSLAVRVPLLPQTNMHEDVYSLPEGRVVVQWPGTLSAESIQEVKDYLKLLERKIMRSTAKTSPPVDESGAAN